VTVCPPWRPSERRCSDDGYIHGGINHNRGKGRRRTDSYRKELERTRGRVGSHCGRAEGDKGSPLGNSSVYDYSLRGCGRGKPTSEHLVAVGTPSARRPPHRSVRARSRIRLLLGMHGGKARIGIRMQNTGLRNPAVQERMEAIPSHSCALTATDQNTPPQPANAIHEHT